MQSYQENYTVVDIETTGLSPQYDDIIELSALKVRNNEVVEEFSSLLKSQKGVNSFITDLTGITNRMLMSAPEIDEVLPKFLSFIEDDTILGHNVNFDMRFIKNKTQRVLNKNIENPIMDNNDISKKQFKTTKFQACDYCSAL